VRCLYSRSACSSLQAPRASGSLGGLAHTCDCVHAFACVSVCTCVCVVVWQLRNIQIVLWAGPQPNPNPHPLLQCTTFKYLTTTLYWLLFLIGTCLAFSLHIQCFCLEKHSKCAIWQFFVFFSFLMLIY